MIYSDSIIRNLHIKEIEETEREGDDLLTSHLLIHIYCYVYLQIHCIEQYNNNISFINCLLIISYHFLNSL